MDLNIIKDMVETKRNAKGQFIRGNILSEEHRKSIGVALKGKKRPIEIGRKISVGLKGRKLSEIHRLKAIKILRRYSNPFLGRHHSEESKKKMSVSMKGKNKGSKNYHWKGGYQNKLQLNRERRMLKLQIIGTHTLNDWEILKKQYGHTCPCCKREEPDIILTEDHIIPLSKGGSNFIENIQPLCKSCNSKKYNTIVSIETLARINGYKDIH